jgi:hypothetical protein
MSGSNYCIQESTLFKSFKEYMPKQKMGRKELIEPKFGGRIGGLEGTRKHNCAHKKNHYEPGSYFNLCPL